jgi:hypothetical protein
MKLQSDVHITGMEETMNAYRILVEKHPIKDLE